MKLACDSWLIVRGLSSMEAIRRRDAGGFLVRHDWTRSHSLAMQTGPSILCGIAPVRAYRLEVEYGVGQETALHWLFSLDACNWWQIS